MCFIQIPGADPLQAGYWSKMATGDRFRAAGSYRASDKNLRPWNSISDQAILEREGKIEGDKKLLQFFAPTDTGGQLGGGEVWKAGLPLLLTVIASSRMRARVLLSLPLLLHSFIHRFEFSVYRRWSWALDRIQTRFESRESRRRGNRGRS